MSRTVSDSAGMLLAELRDALKKAFLLSFVKSGNTTTIVTTLSDLSLKQDSLRQPPENANTTAHTHAVRQHACESTA